jgi:hypothetical protein
MSALQVASATFLFKNSAQSVDYMICKQKFKVLNGNGRKCFLGPVLEREILVWTLEENVENVCCSASYLMLLHNVKQHNVNVT